MIHILRDSEQAALAGSRLMRVLLRGYHRSGRSVIWALSGGDSPARLYQVLAGRDGNALPWPDISVIWGDERCVTPDDERSNYRLAEISGLLARPLGGIYRMPGELPPEEGARDYEAALRQLLPVDRPRLDVALLGLGEDGHTASLFPGTPGLLERERWVIPTGVYGGVRRLTLTLPVLAAAGSILFLVTGEGKAEALRKTLGRMSPAEPAPARVLLDMIAVKRKVGWDCPTVTWVVDKAAASLLPSTRARRKR